MSGDRWLVGQHSGYAQWLRFDASDETRFAYELEADVEPTIDYCHERRTAGNRGYSASGNIQHLASYPPIVIEIYKKLWGADPMEKGNEDLLKRMLNDPDLAKFRTGEGWV